MLSLQILCWQKIALTKLDKYWFPLASNEFEPIINEHFGLERVL